VVAALVAYLLHMKAVVVVLVDIEQEVWNLP
jgi:hypothetical protein